MKGLCGMAMALALAATASTTAAQTTVETPNKDSYWVYIKDKDGIVSMYPVGGGHDGRGWATTDQFEQLISQPADASAPPSVFDRRGTVCAGPACPDATMMRRLHNIPDFPLGTFVLRGTAQHAVFLERQ